MPTAPRRIQELIEEQKTEIEQIMPTLLAKFHEQKDKQETLFFRGKEGVKSVFEDQINDGEDVYIIGASHEAKEQLKYYISHYTNKRIKNKVKLHALYAGKKHKVDVPLASVKYLPDSFATLVSTNIWGNKCAIILWLPHDPVAILIKQPDIAQTFKKYFEVLWKIAKD